MMQNGDAPKTEREIVVTPEPVDVVVAEGDGNALAIALPLDDISEMAAIRPYLVSLDESHEAFAESRRALFKIELDRQRQKLEKYSESSVLYNRLAALAAAAGEFEDESTFLERAARNSSDAFFRHRRADNFVLRGYDKEAAQIFESMDLSTDVQANLKLAALHVRHQEIEMAELWVGKALEIDTTDYAARLFDGGLALIRGEHERAIGSFRIAAAERDRSSALFVNMGLAYAKLDQREKALSSLKRAVVLDPLNANALVLLSDLSHSYGLYAEAIPSLRFYVQFEQKKASIWARLARATFHMGQMDEAITALKRQGSLQDSAAVWNNLGVAYYRSGNVQKAAGAFVHATTKDDPSAGRSSMLSVRNLAALLLESSKVSEVLALTSAVLEEDSSRAFVTDDTLADVYAFHVNALRKAGRLDEALEWSERLLSQPDIAAPLREWLAGNYLAYVSLYFKDRDRVLSILESIRGWLENVRPRDEARRSLLFNNAAFAFAEFGLVQDAERFLTRIGSVLHRDAYPTATLGLIQMRKGRIDRAVELYEEAVRLAVGRADKTRIRQKLNLELGRYWVSRDESKAKRLLDRAASEKHGESALAEQARRELAGITIRK